MLVSLEFHMFDLLGPNKCGHHAHKLLLFYQVRTVIPAHTSFQEDCGESVYSFALKTLLSLSMHPIIY